MITEEQLYANWSFLLATPQAPPGISGVLISKCKKYRRDYIEAKGSVFGAPVIHVLGKQIYMMAWTLMVSSRIAFFKKRKEVPIVDPEVQTALEANLVVQRMAQEKAQQEAAWNQYGPYSAGTSTAPTSGQWTTQTGVPSNFPYGTITTSNTYPTVSGGTYVFPTVAQMQQYQNAAQTQNPYTSGASSAGNAIKKMLGIP